MCVYIYIYKHTYFNAYHVKRRAIMDVLNSYIYIVIYKRMSREKKDNNGRGARTLATTAKAVTRYFSEGMQPPSSSHCSPADAE